MKKKFHNYQNKKIMTHVTQNVVDKFILDFKKTCKENNK